MHRLSIQTEGTEFLGGGKESHRKPVGTYGESNHGQRSPRGRETGEGNAWSVHHGRGHSAGGPHPGVLLVEDSPQDSKIMLRLYVEFRA